MMKTFCRFFLAFVFSLGTSITSAQTPSQFNYQAVLRNVDGTTVNNQPISVKVEILQGSASGTIVFTETHSVTTSAQGLINLQIGSVNSGLGSIDWGTSSHFVRISVNDVEFGTSQLLSVPYAMHAKNAETISGGITETDPIFGTSAASTITNTDISNWNVAANSSAFPAGIIQAFAGSSTPAGYLICDGSAVSRTTYANLFTTIGTIYGNGDGSTTFNLPDLRQRIPVGLNTTGTFNSLGKTGGSETHAITVSEIPEHNHNASTASAGSHTHTGTTSTTGNHTHNFTYTVGFSSITAALNYGSYNLLYNPNSQTSSTASSGSHNHTLSITADGNHTHIVTVNNTGGNQPISLLQPYIVLNYIIKY
jgi:microcystin-dependent protein